MSNQPEADTSALLRQLYSLLSPQDIEQFYAGYQLFEAEQLVQKLQNQIATLQQQIIENIGHVEAARPSALALAALARLQSNGVNDPDILDYLLLRGEEWLDFTMQRLDYCEQMNMIVDNDYTRWCEHALEGTYDWIDSLLVTTLQSDETPTEDPTHQQLTLLPLKEEEEEAESEVSEESLLQMLASDGEIEEPETAEVDEPAKPETPEAAEIDEPEALQAPIEESATAPEQPTAIYNPETELAGTDIVADESDTPTEVRLAITPDQKPASETEEAPEPEPASSEELENQATTPTLEPPATTEHPEIEDPQSAVDQADVIESEQEPAEALERTGNDTEHDSDTVHDAAEHDSDVDQEDIDQETETTQDAPDTETTPEAPIEATLARESEQEESVSSETDEQLSEQNAQIKDETQSDEAISQLQTDSGFYIPGRKINSPRLMKRALKKLRKHK